MAKQRARRPRRPLSTRRATEFNPDYTYVKKDLRRIFSLAGFFIAAMVVLSFFLK